MKYYLGQNNNGTYAIWDGSLDILYIVMPGYINEFLEQGEALHNSPEDTKVRMTDRWFTGVEIWPVDRREENKSNAIELVEPTERRMIHPEYMYAISESQPDFVFE